MIRTYLDSGVLIGRVKGTPDIVDAVDRLIRDPNRVFVSSPFVRLEVLPKAIFLNRRIEVAFYSRFFARVAAWAEPTELVVNLAEQEAQRFGLSAMDALHVAAATLLHADQLITTEGPRKLIHRTVSVSVVAL